MLQQALPPASLAGWQVRIPVHQLQAMEGGMKEIKVFITADLDDWEVTEIELDIENAVSRWMDAHEYTVTTFDVPEGM